MLKFEAKKGDFANLAKTGGLQPLLSAPPPMRKAVLHNMLCWGKFCLFCWLGELKLFLYSLLSNVVCISSFHISNPREIMPRIND